MDGSWKFRWNNISSEYADPTIEVVNYDVQQQQYIIHYFYLDEFGERVNAAFAFVDFWRHIFNQDITLISPEGNYENN